MGRKMAYEKVKFNTRSEWLENRVIGGSGAAAIIGENPWKTNVDYYQEMIKSTAKPPSNEKDDPSSVYWFGTHAEKPLRDIFALAHYDEYEVIPPPSVETDGYIEMYVDTDYPFMTATPDGFVIDKATGQKGIYEGKTATAYSMAAQRAWYGAIPNVYLYQCLHYLMVLDDCDFVILQALIRTNDDKWELRVYTLKRKEWQSEIDKLRQAEIEFWGYVVNKTEPPLLINI